ncbi:MAG: hypothetical protein ACE5D3_04425, partial [Candidatus Binatia bacterium]
RRRVVGGNPGFGEAARLECGAPVFGGGMKIVGLALALWCCLFVATDVVASVMVPEAAAPVEVADLSFDGFCGAAATWPVGGGIFGGESGSLRGNTAQDHLSELASFDRMGLAHPFRDRGLILLGALFLLVALAAAIWDVQHLRSIDDY